MRKTLTALSLMILTGALPVLAQTGPGLGVGAYAGLNFPVAQDDQTRGAEYGFAGRFGLAPLIVVQPYVSFVKWGKPGTVSGVDLGIDGSKVTSYGIEAEIGNFPGQIGMAPYFVAGIGSYKIKNDDTGFDQNRFGYSGGIGLGFGLSRQLGLDVRARFIVVPQKEGGSKKAIGATGGVNFSFGGE